MPQSWKTVRVFISSTFRDMHAERNHLVKVVFMALRERLEQYRVWKHLEIQSAGNYGKRLTVTTFSHVRRCMSLSSARSRSQDTEI